MRDALRGYEDWDVVLPRLEMHGVLPLIASNLGRAGIALPEDVASTLQARVRTLRERSRKTLFTIQRLQEACRDSDVSPIILKGASLLLDIYPQRDFRNQGDVDVLVSKGQLSSMIALARENGWVEDQDQLPTWWYELTHFHVKLAPQHPGLEPLEIHWRLQSEALLYQVDEARLFERCSYIDVDGVGSFKTLHPVDRFLHLATHLASHARDRETLNNQPVVHALMASSPSLRLKWFVDLGGAAESLSRTVESREVAAEAERWGARDVIADVAKAVSGVLPLTRQTATWLDELGANRVAPRRAGKFRWSRWAREDASCHPVFGFGFDALKHWMPWCLPDPSFFRRRNPRLRFLLAARLFHALAVITRSGLCLALLPLAAIGRYALRRSRVRRRERLLEPQRVLDAAVAYRRLDKSFEP